jgi:hypothetical protein
MKGRRKLSVSEQRRENEAESAEEDHQLADKHDLLAAAHITEFVIGRNRTAWRDALLYGHDFSPLVCLS